MTEKCYRHPNRDVVAPCRYCGRYSCDESLVHNKKAKYYSCKDTQDCLTCQQSQSTGGDAYMQDHKALLTNLDKDLQRLVEIMERMDEIGPIFERVGAIASPQGDSDALLYINDSVNTLRIPAFFAYHLAQEGLSLLHVLAVSCAVGKESCGDSSERFDGILKHIDEVEPFLRQTAYDMEPYTAANPVEALASRFVEKGKK
jgi:hypothetical protein